MNARPFNPADPFADLESDFGAPDAGSATAVRSSGSYLDDVRGHAIAEHGSRSKSAPAPMVPCSRCGGSGRYAGYGTCFKCGGSGKERGLKQDPASVKAREKAAAKREQARVDRHRDHEANRAAFYAEHKAEIDYLREQVNSPRGWPGFGESLWEQYMNRAYLSAGQLDVLRRGIERQSERKAASEARVQAAPSVQGEGFAKLTAAFQSAKANGLKYPKIRIAGLVISLAGDNSKNPGCLYIKAGNGFEAPYLGKVTPDAHFLKGRDCSAEQAEQIIAIGRDPLAEAVAHGKQTGTCACCGRELTDPVSIERGIGPICAENFGW